jgi:hypothetical protein
LPGQRRTERTSALDALACMRTLRPATVVDGECPPRFARRKAKSTGQCFSSGATSFNTLKRPRHVGVFTNIGNKRFPTRIWRAFGTECATTIAGMKASSNHVALSLLDGDLMRYCPVPCERPCYLWCEVLDGDRTKQTARVTKRQQSPARRPRRSVRHMPAPRPAPSAPPKARRRSR